MDTITHAIIGATVARATAPASAARDGLNIKQRTGIGALAAAFPDIDYVTILIDPLAFIAEWHRSLTHSLVMLPLWALLLGYILARLMHARPQRSAIILVCGLALASHILTDLITSWGTQIFAPLSDFAPAWGLTFIIDPWFSAIIALALFFSILKHSRHAARVGLVLLALYVGMQTVLKQQAYALGRSYATQQNLATAEVHSIPQPLSPFNWMIVLSADSQYHMALVNLLRRDGQALPDAFNFPLLGLLRHYQPQDQLHWTSFPRATTQPQVAGAWSHPALKLYRKFAMLPYVYQYDNNRDKTCAWFADLRFYLPDLASPFRYGMCQSDKNGNWHLYQLTGERLDTATRQPISYD